MKKVIHIEDNPEWRKIVRIALATNREIELNSFKSVDDFRRANYPFADLYICDRHLPERNSEHPNDHSWKQLLNTINCLYPDTKIVILSSHPPEKSYKNIVRTTKKTPIVCDFDIARFRNEIEYYLGLNPFESVDDPRRAN